MKTKSLLTLVILGTTIAPLAQAQNATVPVQQTPAAQMSAPSTDTKVKAAPTTATPNESKTHYVRKPHTKVVHMQHRMLFNYPNPHPAYIVTFTEEDMKRFAPHQPAPKELQNAAYAHRSPSNIDDAIVDAASAN